MGSFIECNDTLQITTEQGFPDDILNLDIHRSNPITIQQVMGKVFSFYNKPNARIYHTFPTRCFLVHNINGKWLYWGKIMIIEQTIYVDEQGNKTTSGKYKIIAIYPPEYQEQITRNETSEGLSFFE